MLERSRPSASATAVRLIPRSKCHSRANRFSSGDMRGPFFVFSPPFTVGLFLALPFITSFLAMVGRADEIRGRLAINGRTSLADAVRAAVTAMTLMRRGIQHHMLV